jgi:hypothetical protein
MAGEEDGKYREIPERIEGEILAIFQIRYQG